MISINSFSKYFNMTGWRLGWMVVPEAMVPVVERVAQNLFICASTISQHAPPWPVSSPRALPSTSAAAPSSRPGATYFIPALEALGLPVPVQPDGAFYAWADCRAAAARTLGVQGSWDFAYAVMERAHLAITPGRDFGRRSTPADFVRFSTANSMEQLQEAVRRLQRLLA